MMHLLKEKKYKKWNREEEICDAWQSYRNWIKKNERGSPTLTGDQSKLVTHAIITHRIAVNRILLHKEQKHTWIYSSLMQ